MKNFIKKLGVFGIAIAMLIPFVELPVVKADSECTDYSLHQYFFLDKTNGDSWNHYTTSSGYVTYTSFIDLFPVLGQDQKIEIMNAKIESKFTTEADSTVNEVSLSDYYAGIKDLMTTGVVKGATSRIGNFDVTTGDINDYSLSRVLHGSWKRESDTSETSADWELKKSGVSDMETYFLNHTLQGVLKTAGDNDYINDTENVTISGAKYSSNSYVKDSRYTLKEYLSKVANRTESEYVYNKSGDNDNEYFALRIARKLDSSLLNDLVFGYKCSKDTGCSDADVSAGKYVMFTTTPSDTSKATNSYEALTNYLKNKDNAEEQAKYIVHIEKTAAEDKTKDTYIDVLTTDEYYWPAMLNVEFKVCPTANGGETEDPETPGETAKWTLKYNGNVSDNSVKGLPKSESADWGSRITISSTTPTRKGYAFKGWCLDEKKCSNPLDAGDEVKSPETPTTVVAYAQWGKTGTEDNQGTGVVSYIIGFLSVGAIAAAIYFVAKKKNLFKQI